MDTRRKQSLDQLRQQLNELGSASPASPPETPPSGQPSAQPSGLRAYALRLLARRDYPRAELERKLARRCAQRIAMQAEDDGEDFDASFATDADVDAGETRAADAWAIAALLDELAARGLLSDTRYAENRVRSRAGRYGNARLEQELRQKGVDSEARADAIAACGSEFERAAALWRRRFGSAPADASERLRQMRYLAGRGFSGDTVRRVLADAANLCADAREDGEPC